MFRTSFANGPKHRIDDVRLAATIGTHDRSDSLRKGKMEAVHKRFKPGHFKCLKFHEDPLATFEISITSSKPNVKAPAYCRDVDILSYSLCSIKSTAFLSLWVTVELPR